LKPWQAGQFQQQKKNREDEVKVGCVPPLVDDQPFFFLPKSTQDLGNYHYQSSQSSKKSLFTKHNGIISRV